MKSHEHHGKYLFAFLFQVFDESHNLFGDG